jgi:hypothetical protein
MDRRGDCLLYIRALKEDLDRLNALAAGWAEDARCAHIDLRYARERQLEALRAHRERAAGRLLEAQAASAETWEQAALGLDQAWREMREAYGIARLYFEPERHDPGAR